MKNLSDEFLKQSHFIPQSAEFHLGLFFWLKWRADVNFAGLKSFSRASKVCLPFVLTGNSSVQMDRIARISQLLRLRIDKCSKLWGLLVKDFPTAGVRWYVFRLTCFIGLHYFLVRIRTPAKQFVFCTTCTLSNQSILTVIIDQKYCCMRMADHQTIHILEMVSKLSNTLRSMQCVLSIRLIVRFFRSAFCYEHPQHRYERFDIFVRAFQQLTHHMFITDHIEV